MQDKAAFTPPSLLLATIALSLATFMQVLDTTIANVALPTIAGNLGVSSDQGTWVITSFAVCNAIALPLTGWFTRRFGQLKLFVGSVTMFTLTSFLCGFAHSMTELIIFRALQGFFAGPMFPMCQTLLLVIFPTTKRSMALALLSMVTVVAPIVGPITGGWLTDNYSWPWIFYINVPVGMLSVGATWAIFRNRDSARKALPIDAIGLGLLVVWVSAMQIMLDIGKEHDWFQSPMVVACAVIAVVGLLYFLIWELGDKHPVVDLRLFKNRNFWAGTLAISVGYGLFFGNVVLLPLWLQQFMGYTATDAGLVLAPVGLLALVLSPVVGKTIHKVDPRRYATASFIVFGLVMWMRSRFNTQVDLTTIMIPTIVQGAAMAGFFIPLMTITLSDIPPEKMPSASGLSNFVRITAGAVGTSVATTLWERRATLHHAQLVEHISLGDGPTAQVVQGLQATGLTLQQALARVDQLVNQQAFMLAANDIFWASSMLFLLLIPLVWLAKGPKKGQGGGGSEAASAAH